MRGMTISEVAAASGFSASAIRYYEGIGLLPAPERSASGYRLYGREVLGRLQFVERAKRLGLSLSEIAVLLGSWSEGACSLTRDRLQRLLAEKLEEVRRRVEELTALGGQLEDAYERLAGRPPQARCGASCGCPPDVGTHARTDPEVGIPQCFGS